MNKSHYTYLDKKHTPIIGLHIKARKSRAISP